MARKFSDLGDLLTLPLTAGVVTNYNGVNYLLRLSSLQGLTTKGSLGLSNVDNTSDAGKPLSDLAIAALAGKAALQHNHPTGEITGLSDLLLQFAPVNHTQAISTIIGLQAVLDSKLGAGDPVAISNVTGLQTALAGKAPTVHSHQINDVANLTETLQSVVQAVAGKANVVHNHTAVDVTDFRTNVIQILNDIGVVESPVAVGALAW